MSASWTRFELRQEAENPEAHWLRTVMERDGPQWFTIGLPRDVATELLVAMAIRYVDAGAARSIGPDSEIMAAEVTELVEQGALIAQESFATLFRFIQGTGEHIVTDLLVPEEAREAAFALVALDGVTLADLGPALGPVPTTNYRLRIPDSDPPELLPDDPEVIVAIIDDGIGIANHRFRRARCETRIEYFLDMNLPGPKTSGVAVPGSPKPWTDIAGQAWTKADIDALLAGHDGRDEEVIYRAMGMIDPAVDRRQPLKFQTSHGTHVLDLFTGYDYRSDIEEVQRAVRRRPIIAVQVPSEAVIDRSDSQMAQSIRIALAWIEAKAREIAHRRAGADGKPRPLPIVVNFSFGMFAGPTDGQSEIEQRISGFIDRYRSQPDTPGCEVVLAGGNGFQARAVSKLKLGPENRDKPAVIHWRHPPDDRTSSYMQIWLPESNVSDQQVAVTITPPRCAPAVAEWSELGKGLDLVVGSQIFVRLYHQKVPRPGGMTRERVTIAIRPTGSPGGRMPLAPSGLWKVHIRKTNGERHQPVELRVQRDDPVSFQRPSGRQSFFDEKTTLRFDPISGRLINDETLNNGPVCRERTLSSYATGFDDGDIEPVVVGGYRRSDGDPAIYSSSGPVISGRAGPTLAARSEETTAHPGVQASGTASGTAAIMNGTSVAAPQVARRLADLFADCGDRQDLLDEVAASERAGPDGWHESYECRRLARHGVGRLLPPPPPFNRRRIDSCRRGRDAS